MLGWIKNLNYQEFETYCYYLDRNIDYLTQKFHLHSYHFHHIPEDFESVCKQIISDEIDILVILDIGMYAEMSKIAGLRLAHIQCTTWGHPITSGIPTVDYFLSSELMEPQNAQEHYSEKLICLPNIGVSYPKPVIPELTKKRSEFKLKEESIVYHEEGPRRCRNSLRCTEGLGSIRWGEVEHHPKNQRHDAESSVYIRIGFVHQGQSQD